MPKNMFVRRENRGISRTVKWIKCMHFWYLFYNSGEYFQKVATGEGANYVMNNEDIFNVFLQEIKS